MRLNTSSIYKVTRLRDPSAQRRLVARAAEVGKSWLELPGARRRAVLTALIERIDVGADQIDIHLRATRLGALLDVGHSGAGRPSASPGYLGDRGLLTQRWRGLDSNF